MKKVTKILALILAAVTLLSVMAVPVFAEYYYPMTCTVYYKNEKGKQIASPSTFTVNAAESKEHSRGRFITLYLRVCPERQQRFLCHL